MPARAILLRAGLPITLACVCAGLCLYGQRGAGLALGIIIPPLSLLLRGAFNRGLRHEH